VLRFRVGTDDNYETNYEKQLQHNVSTTPRKSELIQRQQYRWSRGIVHRVQIRNRRVRGTWKQSAGGAGAAALERHSGSRCGRKLLRLVNGILSCSWLHQPEHSASLLLLLVLLMQSSHVRRKHCTIGTLLWHQLKKQLHPVSHLR